MPCQTLSAPRSLQKHAQYDPRSTALGRQSLNMKRVIPLQFVTAWVLMVLLRTAQHAKVRP
jgi:hypothetical protein